MGKNPDFSNGVCTWLKTMAIFLAKFVLVESDNLLVVE